MSDPQKQKIEHEGENLWADGAGALAILVVIVAAAVWLRNATLAFQFLIG